MAFFVFFVVQLTRLSSSSCSRQCNGSFNGEKKRTKVHLSSVGLGMGNNCSCNFVAGISGGGSLPVLIDKFYEEIGVKVQSGYGLTEMSHVVAARRPFLNVLGTISHPFIGTETKVFDVETEANFPDSSKGILKSRGPRVMKGYYKNPSAISDVIDKEGWFNSGDIGYIAPKHNLGQHHKCSGMITLKGRAKDTIVLSTGENVEPSELEDVAMRSSLIQINVVGQDQQRLGALIMPNQDEVLKAAKKHRAFNSDIAKLRKEIMMNLICGELRKWTSDYSFQIGPILVLGEPFTIDNGFMTPTMKIRRDTVTTWYKEQIASMYK